jgi:glucan phosphoethanolaminetransferase (alkaline phosphatase superfamily)
MPPMPEKKTKWPLVIGIIAIILGAIGLIGGLAGLAGTTTSPDPAINKWAQQLQPPLAVRAIGCVVTAVLLLAGILLVTRKRLARPAFLFYAVANFATGCFAMYWTFGKMGDFPMPASAPAQTAEVMRTSMRVGAVFGVVFLVAICAFVVIWFLRPKIKQEVSRWS